MINLGWGLVWTIVNLIVLYLLLKKFLVSPVLGIMEKKKKPDRFPAGGSQDDSAEGRRTERTL